MTTSTEATPAQAFSNAFGSLLAVRTFCKDVDTLPEWYSSVLSLARSAAPYGAWIGEGILMEAGYRKACPEHYAEAEQQLRTICPQGELEDCLPRDIEGLVYRVLVGCSEKDILRWCALWASQNRLDRTMAD